MKSPSSCIVSLGLGPAKLVPAAVVPAAAGTADVTSRNGAVYTMEGKP